MNGVGTCSPWFGWICSTSCLAYLHIPVFRKDLQGSCLELYCEFSQQFPANFPYDISRKDSKTVNKRTRVANNEYRLRIAFDVEVPTTSSAFLQFLVSQNLGSPYFGTVASGFRYKSSARRMVLLTESQTEVNDS